MVIKLAGAGVITLETAIGIMAGGGAAVGGGTELANQVQSGGAINPGAIATRTAFGGVKGALWGLAPELGAVGFGASIGGYSAVENLTYNAAKGKTTASDSIEAIAGGLGEGLFAGIMHKASSKVASRASESTPAKPEPIKQMTEAELEKVSGGAKDPRWKPGAVVNNNSNKINWTNHGYKHFPDKNSTWKNIVKSTQGGPAKYYTGIDNIELFERNAWDTGTAVTNGKNWRVKEYDYIIGATEGKETKYVRIENSGNTIHGHPISISEYQKLLK